LQGAGDMGCATATLPGYDHTDDAAARQRIEQIWNVKLPTTKGLDNHEMTEAILDGRLRAMYIMGEEMSLVDSNANHVQEAFEKLEFFVVQDIFFSHTCGYADVVLPAAPSLEKEGTFTSTERRIQRLYQVFEPLEGCKPDWRIVQDVANRMGAHWDYKHPSDVMDEIAKAAPIMAGVSYSRLEGYASLQWPVDADGSDQPLLYTKQFNFPDGKAKLHPLKITDPSEQPDAEFDLHLNNGRLLEHFHEGNLTNRVAGIHERTPDNWVEVSPELAAERGIQSGSHVELKSRHGEVRLRAVVTDRVQGKQLYMSMNSTKSAVNRLTSSNADSVTHTPAYKEVAVSLRVLPLKGMSPLRKGNWRLGHPTPQRGVEVERKWKRPDYHLPGTRLVQLGVPVPRSDSNGSSNPV
jgi:formate dehydrogenase major subunit